MAAGRVLPAKITYDRDLHLPEIPRGGVLWRGQNGKMRTTVLEYDGERPVQVDAILDATLTETGGGYELSGVSQRLVDEIGLSRGEAQVTLKVTPLRDCVGCK